MITRHLFLKQSEWLIFFHVQYVEIIWCGVHVITKQIGSAINVDVIKFEPILMEAIVRVKERYVVCDVIYNNKSKANACPNEITIFF